MGEVGRRGKLVVSDGAMGMGDGQGDGSLDESPAPLMALYNCKRAIGMAAALAAAAKASFSFACSPEDESSG